MTFAARLRPRLTAALVLALVPGLAFAEAADRNKDIVFSSDQPFEGNLLEKKGTVKGNVVITQGTISIHADRIEFKQNADNSLSATAYGNPVSFREKKDNSDEYYEGYAQRAVYNGQKQTLELYDNALLKEGNNELRGNYVFYNNVTGEYRVEGAPKGAAKAGESRVRGVFQPRNEGQAVPAAKGGGGKDSAAPKGGAKEAPGPKDAANAKRGQAAAPPLALKPDKSLSAK
jgi:lipopolysaccharide export system protein LptA